MSLMRIAASIFISACLLGNALSPSPDARAQEIQESQAMSAKMQAAIKAFNRGKDTEALDKFMEILTQGAASERPMANEYLNLITQRMAMGEGGSASRIQAPSPQPAAPATPAAPAAQAAPASAPQRQPEPLLGRGVLDAILRPAGERAPEPKPSLQERSSEPKPAFEARPPSRQEAEPERVTKASVKQEILNAIRSKARRYLNEIGGFRDVRIVMSDKRVPLAVGIPTDLLFGSGILFRKDASAVLRSLTGLIYCLPTAQVAILPEGAAIADSKILDMRRTMGISSYLLSAGIAPARVRVNYLQSQIELPRGISDFRGIIVLFIYDQPLHLASERFASEDSGPVVSLGVFPDKVASDRNEGSVVEFSIMEPPAGLASWRFQIFRPGSRSDAQAPSLQDISGEKPVFHQLYWNGRRNYSGEKFDPGRYEFVVTAVDSKGKSKALHRWITLDGASFAQQAEAVSAPLPVPARRPPPAQIKSQPRPQAPAVHKKLKAGKGKPVAGRSSKTGRAPLPQPPASAKPPAPPAVQPAAQGLEPPAAYRAEDSAAQDKPSPASDGAVNYKIDFAPDSETITQAGERRLAQVAETMTYYPLENLRLIGYAGPNEAQAQTLAGNRAKVVSSVLVNRYNVDARRIRLESRVAQTQRCEVEIYIVAVKE